jgi:beta-aspartyl-peptidase (threonine type)
VVGEKLQYSNAKRRAVRSSIKKALQVGHDALLKGVPSFEVAALVVGSLENCPQLNAGIGHGTSRTSGGYLELEASIMDGKTLRFGACALIQRLANPIELAALLARSGRAPFMAGLEADELGLNHGLRPSPPPQLKPRHSSAQKSNVQQDTESSGGTVGAVILDLGGRLAAATSSGGINGKPPGRISDTSIVGHGTFASNRSAAISCTGIGEHMMALATARELAARIEFGRASLEAACEMSLNDVRLLGGRAGLVALDRDGTGVVANYSAGINWGVKSISGLEKVSVFGD